MKSRIFRLGVVVAGVVLAAALAASSAAAKPTSFAGSCTVQGTVAFDPPATFTEQQLNVAYDAAGTCSGRLDGRAVADKPVTLHHAGSSLGSCLGARTTAPGNGAITFAGGPIVPYSFTFQAIGTEVFFSLAGRRSGEATGYGSFLTTRTPFDAGANCAGSGDARLPMDLTVQTTSPLVSGKPVKRRSR